MGPGFRIRESISASNLDWREDQADSWIRLGDSDEKQVKCLADRIQMEVNWWLPNSSFYFDK
jgi:hypothetical protein